MQNYLADGNLDALREYLARYNESLPNDSLIRFCENTAANAVLLYFSQQAKENDVDFIAQVEIPEDIFIRQSD